MTIIADATVEVEEWCDRVRALHAEHAGPIHSIDDPRAVSYAALATVKGFTPHTLEHEIKRSPEYAGQLYFENCIELPKPPIAGPDWALVSPELAVAWPDIHVEFVSEDMRVENLTVWASQVYAIQVDAQGEDGAPVAALQNLTPNGANVTIMFGGHPIDFYGVTVADLCSASAALALVAGMIGKERGL